MFFFFPRPYAVASQTTFPPLTPHGMQVNGTACSQHPYLINGLLKDELGFQGFVMSDWLGHMSGVASALAGLDMDMPGDTQVPFIGHSYWMYELTRAALNGSVPMDRVNDMATRVLAARFRMGQDAADYPATNFDTNTRARDGLLYPAAFPDSPVGVVNEFVDATRDHAGVARQVAREAITLLKNEGGLLPLATTRPLRVFGSDAQANPAGANACADRNCNRGTLGQGWGSGSVDYVHLDDPIGALRARAADVRYHAGDAFPGALAAPAGDDDVAIVFISADSGENTYTVEGNHGDRDAAGLHAWHGGDALVQAAAGAYKNVVVVAHTVGPLLVEAWHDLPAVKAVLVAHLPGQEAGGSLAEVLFGDASPCGHLPYSMARREEDMARSVTELIAHEVPGRQPQDTYSEGLYVDYRWLDRQGTAPRYAFGHGLSYTTFALANASVARVTPLTETPPAARARGPVLEYAQAAPAADEAVRPAGAARPRWRYLYSWLGRGEAEAAAAARDGGGARYPYPDGYSGEQRSAGPRAGGGEGGNPALWDEAYRVTVRVANTGARHAGKASVQAYLQFPDGTAWETPRLQLRDFEKTAALAPGAGETVELRLTRKDMSVWDAARQDWVVPRVDGAYRVWLGFASDDLRVVCRLDELRCEAVGE